jgi:Swi5-dependent recombination DNA repair protein 1
MTPIKLRRNDNMTSDTIDTPTAKRRRMDGATSILSKPFRTPMKKSPSTPAKSNEETSSESSGSARRDCLMMPAPPLPRTPSIYVPPVISTAALNLDTEVAPLIKRQRELEKELRTLREELDVVEQARNIENESRKHDPEGPLDGELTKLIKKWQYVARQAADELFSGALDRVNR